MKKLITILILLLLPLSGCRKQESSNIVATTLPVYEFTSFICDGTDLAVTRLITENVSCLHDYKSPRPWPSCHHPGSVPALRSGSCAGAQCHLRSTDGWVGWEPGCITIAAPSAHPARGLGARRTRLPT